MKYILRFFQSSFFLIGFSLLIICFQFIAPIVFSKCFCAFDGTKISSLIFLVAYALLGFFIVPLVFSWVILRENLRDVGLRRPENNLTALFVIFISILFLAPAMFELSKTSSFHRYYSISHISLLKFVFLNFILSPIYYFAEEFFFRGFLFLNLWRKIRWHGLWVTEVLFAMAHFFKPGLEILFAFPVGLFLNYITLKTKSIYPSMVVHYSLGLLNYSSINFHAITLS